MGSRTISFDSRIAYKSPGIIQNGLISTENSLSHVTRNKLEIEERTKILNTLKMKQETIGYLIVEDIKQALDYLEPNQEELSDSDCRELLQFAVNVVQNDYHPCADLVQRLWMLTSGRTS